MEAAVSEMIQSSPSIGSHEKIWLTVTNRVATISGTVESSEQAQSIIRRVSRVPGIRDVRNQLTTAKKSKDLEIATDLHNSLSADPLTRSYAIAVSVVRGVVFLSGSAQSDEESARASALAQSVDGVQKVSNSLRVLQSNRYDARYTPPRSLFNNASRSR
jgi:osmotically-inducible protein OsmY